MRVVFFGTPQFAVPTLAALLESQHEVVAVVTQPARGAGRGRKSRPSPVRLLAEEHGLAVHEPERLDEGLVEVLRDRAADILVVIAYGKLLPPAVLAAAPHGAVNVHPSLLPRHRGAAPIQRAVLAGDRRTGVTTMQLDEKLDTGGALLVEETSIGDEENSVDLAERLAAMGARLLVETLDALAAGRVSASPQGEEGATYAPKLRAEEAWLEWSEPAVELARRVRGLRPWPVAQTRLSDGRRLKILSASARLGDGGVAGRVVAADKNGLVIACGQGQLVVLEAQVEGKRAMAAADLVNGRVVAVGDRLGV